MGPISWWQQRRELKRALARFAECNASFGKVRGPELLYTENGLFEVRRDDDGKEMVVPFDPSSLR